MKPPRFFVVLTLFWAVCTVQGRADELSIPIDELLLNIQKALIKVRDGSDVDALPPLTAVHLTLRTTLTREADGSLKFRVLEAGAKGSDESVQELHLDLPPPDPSDKSPVGGAASY
jgi:hypothetical protein